MCKDGKGPGTSDQERALYKAKMRLKEAEDKLANCKRWGPLLQHAVHEYHGSARALSGTLHGSGGRWPCCKENSRIWRRTAAPPSTHLPAGVVARAEEALMTASTPHSTAAMPLPGCLLLEGALTGSDENRAGRYGGRKDRHMHLTSSSMVTERQPEGSPCSLGHHERRSGTTRCGLPSKSNTIFPWNTAFWCHLCD